MKSELDEVIEFYEAEREFLRECIKQNQEDFEFMNAHFHSQGLFQVERQLDILYKLKDPNFTRKQELERNIRMYEASFQRSPRLSLDSYYIKELDKNKQELNKLNEQKIGFPLDDQQLDNALFDVVEGKHTGFILYLNSQENLAINFELIEAGLLELSISLKEFLKVDYFFDSDDDSSETRPNNALKQLGFNVNSRSNKLVKIIDTKDFKNAIEIKTILSRLIYDLFRYAEIDNPASLICF